MQSGEQHERTKHTRALVSSVAWSLVLHTALIALWVCLPQHTTPRPERKLQPSGSTMIKIKRGKKSETPPAAPEPEQPPRPFAKTDADRPQQRPAKADFEGQRDARAEGMLPPEHNSDAPVPTMDGEEKEEINTLEQARQDGDVEHYGKKDAPSTTGGENTLDDQTVTPPEPPAPGQVTGTPTEEPADADTTTQGTREATDSVAPIPQQQEGDLRLQHPDDSDKTPTEEAPASPNAGIPQAEGKAPLPVQPRRKRGPVYDPTQADHMQPPGLRTAEKRSRSTGQFILGSRPSLNVEATPRGRYEELVYRLIARQWYAACDTHRGDIIPGTIILAIRINKRGQVVNMNLVTRRGAGVIQQSFTFAAIRKAQIPPMPKEVQKTLLGEQMELIITFNFD